MAKIKYIVIDDWENKGYTGSGWESMRDYNHYLETKHPFKVFSTKTAASKDVPDFDEKRHDIQGIQEKVIFEFVY